MNCKKSFIFPSPQKDSETEKEDISPDVYSPIKRKMKRNIIVEDSETEKEDVSPDVYSPIKRKRKRNIIVEDSPDSNNITDLKTYFDKLEKEIKNICEKTRNNQLTYDILDTKKSMKYKTIALKERQRLMIVGKIWEIAIQNYPQFLKCDIKHGLDIISHSKKVVIELKNRTNTDNSSSRTTNFEKLANFKKKHKEYSCIYANINANTKKLFEKGLKKKIICNNEEIIHYVGFPFLQYVFEKNAKKIIHFIKKTIDKYS